LGSIFTSIFENNMEINSTSLYNPNDQDDFMPVPMDISPTSTPISGNIPVIPSIPDHESFKHSVMYRPLSPVTELNIEEVTGPKASVTDNVQLSTAEHDPIQMI
jgi:hypothetical protein